MSSVSQALFDVHSDDAKNRSIPELISYLKWAFQLSDFEEVKQILVAREEKTKQESRAEIEVWKRRFVELESRVSRFEEVTAVVMNKKAEFLKRVKEEMEVENAGFNEVTREKGRNKVSEYQSSNAGSDYRKVEENKSNSYEKIIELAGGGSQDKGPHSIDMVPVIKVKESDSLNSESKYQRPVRKKLVFEGVTRDIVEISDSDDEIPTVNNCKLASNFKRKRESCINISEVENSGENEDDAYNTSSKIRKMKKLQELIDEPRGLHGDYCSAGPASSGGNNVDKSVRPSRQNLLDGFDSSESEDGSSDSTTDSKDDAESDAYINNLLSKLGKN